LKNISVKDALKNITQEAEDMDFEKELMIADDGNSPSKQTILSLVPNGSKRPSRKKRPKSAKQIGGSVDRLRAAGWYDLQGRARPAAFSQDENILSSGSSEKVQQKISAATKEDERKKQARLKKQAIVNYARMILLHRYCASTATRRQNQIDCDKDSKLCDFAPPMRRQISDSVRQNAATICSPLQLKRASSAPSAMPEMVKEFSHKQTLPVVSPSTLLSLEKNLKCPETGISIELCTFLGHSQPRQCFAVSLIHPASSEFRQITQGFVVQYGFASTSIFTLDSLTVTVLSGLARVNNGSFLKELEATLVEMGSLVLSKAYVSAGLPDHGVEATLNEILGNGFAMTNHLVLKALQQNRLTTTQSLYMPDHLQPMKAKICKHVGYSCDTIGPLKLYKQRVEIENRLAAYSGKVLSGAMARKCLLEAEWNEKQSMDIAQEAGRVAQQVQRKLKYVPPPFGPQECSICMQEYASPAHGLAIDACRHWCCFECWDGYLFSQANDGRPVIKCPAYQCNETLDDASLSVLASSDTRFRLNKWANECVVNFSESAQDWIACWCPGKGCQNSIILTVPPAKICATSSMYLNLDVIDDDVRVPENLEAWCSCSAKFCITCKRNGHWPTSCAQNRLIEKLRDSIDEQLLNERYIRKFTKPCPKCKCNIEKNAGCLHMRCQHCNHFFCWHCGGDGAACGSYKCQRLSSTGGSWVGGNFRTTSQGRELTRAGVGNEEVDFLEFLEREMPRTMAAIENHLKKLHFDISAKNSENTGVRKMVVKLRASNLELLQTSKIILTLMFLAYNQKISHMDLCNLLYERWKQVTVFIFILTDALHQINLENNAGKKKCGHYNNLPLKEKQRERRKRNMEALFNLSELHLFLAQQTLLKSPKEQLKSASYLVNGILQSVHNSTNSMGCVQLSDLRRNLSSHFTTRAHRPKKDKKFKKREDILDRIRFLRGDGLTAHERKGMHSCSGGRGVPAWVSNPKEKGGVESAAQKVRWKGRMKNRRVDKYTMHFLD
jgi:hypothetical protein